MYSLTLTCTIIVTITWAIITGKHQIQIKCTLLHKYVPSLYKISYFNARINSCTVNSNEKNMLGINIHIKLLEAHPADSRILLLFLFLVVHHMNISYGNT